MLMTGLIALLALVLGLTIGSCCGYGLGYSERAKRGREMWKFYHAGRQSGLAEEPQELVVYHYHQHGGLIKEEKTITSKHTRLNVDGTANQRWEPTGGEKLHADAEANGLVKHDHLAEQRAYLQRQMDEQRARDAEHTEEELKQAALKMLDDGTAEYQAANPSKTFTEAALKILEGSRDERLLRADEHEKNRQAWLRNGELAPSQT